ncbi:IS5/IS1182 family transposase, partial [Vibrio mimicus]
MELNSKLTIRSATFIQLCSLMPKPRYKTNNWKQYNQALIKRGRPRIFSDL